MYTKSKLLSASILYSCNENLFPLKNRVEKAKKFCRMVFVYDKLYLKPNFFFLGLCVCIWWAFTRRKVKLFGKSALWKDFVYTVDLPHKYFIKSWRAAALYCCKITLALKTSAAEATCRLLRRTWSPVVSCFCCCSYKYFRTYCILGWIK